MRLPNVHNNYSYSSKSNQKPLSDPHPPRARLKKMNPAYCFSFFYNLVLFLFIKSFKQKLSNKRAYNSKRMLFEMPSDSLPITLSIDDDTDLIFELSNGLVIPIEIIQHHVLEFLNQKDFFRFAAVCAVWRRIAATSHRSFFEGGSTRITPEQCHFELFEMVQFKMCDIDVKLATSIANHSKNITSLLLVGEKKLGVDGVRAIACGNLTNLTMLDLRHCFFGDEGVRELCCGNLQQLKTLKLESNDLYSYSAHFLAESNLNSLTSLNLDSNSIGQKGAKLLAQGRLNLLELHLYNNRIGNEGVIAIGKSQSLSNLQLLDLRYNNLENEAVKELTNLLHLRLVFLNGNKISPDMKLSCSNRF